MAKSSIFLLIWVAGLLGTIDLQLCYSVDSDVPPLYVFGDSTADVGTNNFLPHCKAKADVLFNGIDFPSSTPTGRFSNGYNTVDYIAQSLGFDKSPPPYLSISKSNISHFVIEIVSKKGLNFASGGSGLLHDTGKRKYGRVIPFGEQVEQFASIRSNLSELLGESAVANISKSFFLISVGSNDIFDYFSYNFTTNCTARKDYITTLISTYETHLKNLYDLGARKFGIISVGAIGCCPINRDVKKNGNCSEPMNDDAQFFYTTLKGLLLKLSTSDCKGFLYSLGDANAMSKGVLDDPQHGGFTEVKKACCGRGGKLKAENPCTPDSEVCDDHDSNMFWDQYHPTQKASNLAATGLYELQEPYMTPINFAQLASLP